MPKRSSLAAMKWNREHRSIVNARIKEIKKNNPEKYKAINKAWAAKNADHLKEYHKEYRAAHPEKTRKWHENYVATPRGKEVRAKLSKENYTRLRKAVLAAYSGASPRCECCGEHREEFLTIDHINGGGAKQRREGKRGIAFYVWLIKSNFPDGFRVLCMNCNFSLGMRGYCPHQRERESYTTVSSSTVTNIDKDIQMTYTATSEEN